MISSTEITIRNRRCVGELRIPPIVMISPDRCRPIEGHRMINLDDLDDAIKELERAVRLGLALDAV